MGDTVSFFVGRRLGREFLLKHGARMQITEPRLVLVERYMHEHGGKTILVGRFIGLIRALAPFIAGASKMDYRRFVPYDIIGSGLWATAFCYLGYFFSQNLHEVIHYAERGVLIFGWTVGTIVALVYLVRRFRKPEEREKFSKWLDQQEQHAGRARVIKPLRAIWRRLFLPVMRFFSPQFKFAIGRFTPGGLGLEFTTAAALLAVSSFGFFFFTDFAATGTNAEYLNRLNDAAFTIAAQLQSDWLTTLAKIVTQLGAFYVVAPIALLATVFCAWRRHVPEALVIFFSLAITLILVHVTKAWTDVPRPSGALVPTEGSSYPSGHTAYAVTYITIALALERIGGLFGRVVLVSVAFAIATAVALSRVYLRAHYLTDVLGGTALAVFCASTLACLALVAVFLRSERRGRRIEREGKVIASGTQP
ncbi:MAG: bifunctional DedA family/phosphatase PAP2 family protein, partial [Thermoleophilaceae bacterium]|nr:bifunctional DedA family/phosphatase PAP2 family protein [Thermoleophilaceae bacterium]